MVKWHPTRGSKGHDLNHLVRKVSFPFSEKHGGRLKWQILFKGRQFYDILGGEVFFVSRAAFWLLFCCFLFLNI